MLTFRLLAGNDPEVFQAVDARLQVEFFYQQPGLLRRTTALAADGTWLSLTHWESHSSAETAQAKTVGATEFSQLLTVVDPASLKWQRFEEL